MIKKCYKRNGGQMTQKDTSSFGTGTLLTSSVKTDRLKYGQTYSYHPTFNLPLYFCRTVLTRFFY
jgi:hypothetical protein